MTNLYIVAYSLADIVNPYIVPFSFAVIIAVVVLLAVLADNSSSKQRSANSNNNSSSKKARKGSTSNIDIIGMTIDVQIFKIAVETFFKQVVTNWQSSHFTNHEAYLKEIVLFEICNQVLLYDKNNEFHSLANQAGLYLSEIILLEKDSYSNRGDKIESNKKISVKSVMSANVFFERCRVYEKANNSPKKYEYLYHLCKWSKVHGHDNAVLETGVPKIDFDAGNSVLEEFVEINSLREYSENIPEKDKYALKNCFLFILINRPKY